MEMQLHCTFVLSLPFHLISSILRFGYRILINNVNPSESNDVQVFELSFWFSERLLNKCLPNCLER